MHTERRASDARAEGGRVVVELPTPRSPKSLQASSAAVGQVSSLAESASHALSTWRSSPVSQLSWPEENEAHQIHDACGVIVPEPVARTLVLGESVNLCREMAKALLFPSSTSYTTVIKQNPAANALWDIISQGSKRVALDDWMALSRKLVLCWLPEELYHIFCKELVKMSMSRTAHYVRTRRTACPCLVSFADVASSALYGLQSVVLLDHLELLSHIASALIQDAELRPDCQIESLGLLPGWRVNPAVELESTQRPEPPQFAPFASFRTKRERRVSSVSERAPLYSVSAQDHRLETGGSGALDTELVSIGGATLAPRDQLKHTRLPQTARAQLSVPPRADLVINEQNDPRPCTAREFHTKGAKSMIKRCVKKKRQPAKRVDCAPKAGMPGRRSGLQRPQYSVATKIRPVPPPVPGYGAFKSGTGNGFQDAGQGSVQKTQEETEEETETAQTDMHIQEELELLEKGLTDAVESGESTSICKASTALMSFKHKLQSSSDVLYRPKGELVPEKPKKVFSHIALDELSCDSHTGQWVGLHHSVSSELERKHSSCVAFRRARLVRTSRQKEPAPNCPRPSSAKIRTDTDAVLSTKGEDHLEDKALTRLIQCHNADNRESVEKAEANSQVDCKSID